MFCFIYRWLMSNGLDNGKEPDGFLAEHIEQCPACSGFLASCKSVGFRLKRDSLTVHSDPGGLLNRKIIESLPRQKEMSISPPAGLIGQKFFTPIRFAAACFVMLAVLGVIILMTSPPQETADTGLLKDIISDSSLLPGGIDGVVSVDVILTESMAKEVDNLVSDAQSAANFLIACANSGLSYQQE